jgi:hypothetical protein
VAPHPGVAKSHEELTGRHPELEHVPEEHLDDTDFIFWSAAYDSSYGHVIMSCDWPQSGDVGQFVQRLAAKHGLVFYDPRSDRLVYPDGTAARKKPWWKFW